MIPMSGHDSVEHYLDSFAEPARSRLQELRDLSLRAAPDATEALKWGDPAYLHPEGTILFLFSGFKKHTNFVFTPSTRAAFDDTLAKFETGKGSIRLPYSQSAPEDLLTRMIAYRIREFEVDGVKWM